MGCEVCEAKSVCSAWQSTASALSWLYPWGDTRWPSCASPFGVARRDPKGAKIGLAAKEDAQMRGNITTATSGQMSYVKAPANAN